MEAPRSHKLAGCSAPLGLAISPGGDVLSVNVGNGDIVETTPSGKQVGSRTLVADGAGEPFDLAVAPAGHGLYFTATNDGVGPLLAALFSTAGSQTLVASDPPVTSAAPNSRPVPPAPELEILQAGRRTSSFGQSACAPGPSRTIASIHRPPHVA